MVEGLEGEVTERYFGDVLGSYANGVQLDLRVKLAVDFLKSPWAAQHSTNAKSLVAAALALSTELLEQASALDLIASLPDTNELSAPMRRHIERATRAQIAGQVAAQGLAVEEQPKVQVGGMVRQ